MPGYGYAKVSKKERDRWGKLMDEYFASEDTLTMGFQIVDIRHKPTADDVTMANWFLQTGVPFAIIANKLDKIKKSQLEGSLQTILKVRPELIEKDLDEFLNVMRNIKGKDTCSFCYRMRIGVN